MKRVLVGVDGSSAALKAVDFAADLANKYEAKLVLLTVGRSPGVEPAFEEYARIEHISQPATELALATTRSILDSARDNARAKGAMRISTEWSFGDPAQEIIATARKQHADLIVVGSRGHGRLGGLLVGSVAQKLVSLAPCPVVVVR